MYQYTDNDQSHLPVFNLDQFVGRLIEQQDNQGDDH